MQRSAVVLGFILILVVILTGIVSKSEDSNSEKRKSAKFSTTMSLRPYWYNQELDFSSESPSRYTIDDFIDRGREMRRNRRYRKAEDIFKTALLFDPGNASIIKEIGELVYINERFDEACNYFTQYLALSPDTIESYTNLAVSLIRANEFVTAETIAKKGLSRVGKDEPGPFYLILACVKQETGNQDEAEFFLLKAYTVLGQDILNLLNSQWTLSLKELKSYKDIQMNLSENARKRKPDISREPQ